MKPLVLQVEDDLMFHRLVSLVLGDYAQVDSVFSVQQAIAYLMVRKPDIILLDLMMPDQPGVDLVHHCEKTPELASIPIVTVSASIDPDVISIKSQSVVNKIGKPFGRYELIQTIDQAIQQKFA